MTQSLASIAENIGLLNLSIEPGTEDPEICKLLWEQEAEFDLKAQKLARFIQYTKGEETQIDNEIKRLQVLKKQAKNRIASAERYLIIQMQRANKSQVNTPLTRIHLRAKPDILVINKPIECIPDQFLRVKEEVDKTKVKKYLIDNPDEVDFAVMQKSNECSVIIK